MSDLSGPVGDPLDLDEMQMPTDSECADAVFNPDIWELRRRVDLLTLAVARVLGVCNDPGGPDSWMHTFDGRDSVFVADVLQALGADHA